MIFSLIFQVLAPLGLETLVRKPGFQAVIKSAASAASPTAWGAPRLPATAVGADTPEGFSSRDQVGRKHGLPAARKIREDIVEALKIIEKRLLYRDYYYSP